MGIGDKIKGARIKAGLTQKDLADKLLCSRQNIARMESNKYAPGPHNLVALAKLLNVSVDYLLGERDEPMTNTDLLMTPLKMSEREDLIDKLKAVIKLLETAKDMADTTGHEMEVDRIAFTILSEIMASVQEAAELPFC